MSFVHARLVPHVRAARKMGGEESADGVAMTGFAL